MQCLEYPFDSQYLLRKRKSLRRELLQAEYPLEKRVAVLGGSTTHDIIDMLELFLLNYGIKPSFYESEYGQYWEDAMFDNPELVAFNPDIIYIHTSNRNIRAFPEPDASEAEIKQMVEGEFARFSAMWDHLTEKYHCPIIQNNFEYPFYRLMGNRDATDPHGRVNYISELNRRFCGYARSHESFYISDINYLAADYGLRQWSDPFYWHMYKYAMCLDAIPTVAFNVANLIKSIYGKNNKALALDLDNTLWGGIVGDDGVQNLEIGQETSMGQVYSEFQSYLKELKKYGILLNIVSKNEHENAMAGLAHPQMVLKAEDFVSVKANWEPKSMNLVQMAQELNLLPESFVFADDNPAEREIIRQQVTGVGIPLMDKPENYITAIDRAGYFEITNFSKDDLKRSAMYKENMARTQLENSFANYGDYLLSLDMKAEIRPFEAVYFSRIAQLTNKSNQFNLTTLRCTQQEIEEAAENENVITLYGRLEDRFGDNGVVTVAMARVSGETADITLWLMSCRVLKRDMEFAMMDAMAEECGKRGVTLLRGHYYPTAKNKMVKDFYAKQGFTLVHEDGEGNALWELDLSGGYAPKNHVINVKK